MPPMSTATDTHRADADHGSSRAVPRPEHGVAEALDHAGHGVQRVEERAFPCTLLAEYTTGLTNIQICTRNGMA